MYHTLYKWAKVGKQVKMGKSSSKLSLYPLKFEQTVKGLLKVKPESKVKDTPEVVKGEEQ